MEPQLSLRLLQGLGVPLPLRVPLGMGCLKGSEPIVVWR